MEFYHVFHSTQTRSTSPLLRLALFDLDGTLIASKSGRRWAKDADDWVFKGDVAGVFRSRAADGWTIAIVTNQSEWSTPRSKGAARAKCEAVLAELHTLNGWQPWCLVATGAPTEAVYRKPARGLYDALLREYSGSTVAEVIMCGDAVGPAAERPEYRWSDSDARFAAAIHARFLTPDAVFETRVAAPNVAGRELVLLVGNMGSGKSTTSGRLVEESTADGSLCAFEYVHLEMDVVKTAAKMLRETRKAIGARSVVVDGCHGTAAARAPYIELARELDIPIRILWHIRDGRPYNALRTRVVPEIAYATYSKRFEDPTLDGVPVEKIY